ncbi:FxSxx-COOH system tetratricopeptide repeat protein [Nonomuraea fuscirosea]|uniref:FxSxx-COOH system tetratricopeptide repeat protein n=1 Tax=Nonomuraea fuscirosea TaxID=1291556 RepID=UPI003F4CBFAB
MDDNKSRIITFYSYKGGTGRTMALANVAWIMASRGMRVLAIDWDLEAPGLHKFFRPFLDSTNGNGISGMIRDYAQVAVASNERRTDDWLHEYARVEPHVSPIQWPFPSGGSLDFLSAGSVNRDYAASPVPDWDTFYNLRGGQFLDALREDVKRHYGYTLIDSRTGLCDIGDICTAQMCDVLVDCFTLSGQSIEGAANKAADVVDRYKRTVLPVPMRIEEAEQERLELGRREARMHFDRFLDRNAEQKAAYWGAVEVPYRSFYAYEEVLAVFGDPPHRPGSLLGAYERLTAEITHGEVTSMAPMAEELRQRSLMQFLRRRPTPPTRIAIGYVPEDRMWAEWMDSVLSRAGCDVTRHNVLAARGQAAVADQIKDADRVLTVMSPAFAAAPEARRFVQTAANGDPSGDRRMVGTIRIADVAPHPTWAKSVVDLTRMNETEAAHALLDSVDRAGEHAGLPSIEEAARTPFPGRTPEIWHVPPRNPSFTGRGDLLEALRDQMLRGGTTAVLPQALHGMGGVGKSEVALEYVHRFMADYDLVLWLPAAQPQEINPHFARLAPRLGVYEGDNVFEAAEAVLESLRTGAKYPRYLLVFDNAHAPEDISQFLPGGSGHVLVTTRHQAWAEHAKPLEVDVYSREESVLHLTHRVPGLEEPEARTLADHLGDLPLAIEHAAALLQTSVIPIDAYIERLQTRPVQALTMGLPEDFPITVASTWNVSFEEVTRRSPAAAHLLKLLSFLAPESISTALLHSTHMAQILTPYDETLRDSLLMARVVQELSRLALIKPDARNRSVGVHRLVQAVVRSQMDETERDEIRHQVHDLLVAYKPQRGDVDDPENWPQYAQIWPHLTPSQAVECTSDDTRVLCIDRIRYLWRRGEYGSALKRGEALVERWMDVFGPDDRLTMLLRFNVANIHRSRGRHRRALEIDQDNHERQTRVLGPDHPHTLMTAGSHIADLCTLGRYQEARELAQSTYESFKGIFGENHGRSLSAANNLAMTLRLVGDVHGAQRIDKDTLKRRTEVLGAEHPYTLFSTVSLAIDLRGMGRLKESVEMLRDLYARYLEAGDADKHEALLPARNLAVSLREWGEIEEALELNESTLSRHLRLYGPESPETLACALHHAADMAANGQPHTASTLGRELIEKFEKVFGPGHPNTAAAINNVATYQRYSGGAASAADTLSTTLSQLSDALGSEHPMVLACQVNLANCYTDLGERDTLQQYKELLQRLIAARGSSHLHTLICAANLAIVEKRQHHSEEAAKKKQAALHAFSSVLRAEHPARARLVEDQLIDLDLEAAVIG